jgi:AraC-like DNA-binding protein
MIIARTSEFDQFNQQNVIANGTATTSKHDAFALYQSEQIIWMTARIAELEAHNAELQAAQQRQAERAVREQQLHELRRRILRRNHKGMDPTSKLLALDYLEQAAARFWSLEDLSQPFHPVMEQVAERLGVSESTLTRKNQQMSQAGAWFYDVERTFKERVGTGRHAKEIYDVKVTVALDKLVTSPESIQKPEEKLHGGVRVKRCKNPDCGSDDLDQFGAEYCRSCKSVHLKAMPGLRGDANVFEAMEAIGAGRVTIQDHLYDYATLDSLPDPDEDLDMTSKHDAFSIEEIAALDAEISQLKIDPVSEELPVEDDGPTSKHDAFPIIAPEHLPIVARETACKARIALNKDGQRARALEKIVSQQVCGSTCWQWSKEDNCRICAECWTPQH